MLNLQRQRVIGIVIVLVLISCDWLCGQPGGFGPSPVVVSKAVSIRQSDSKSFVGSLVPLRRSTVGSAVDGRVVEMFAREGNYVEGDSPGQPLVQLRTVSLDIEIEAAHVELRLREQAENELKQSLPAEIEAAQSTVEEIKARLSYQKDNFERLKNLRDTGGGVSKQEVDEAFSMFQSLSQLGLGAETTLKKLLATRASRLQQARSRVEAQEAELRRLQEMKSKYTIRAPFSGYITEKHTELGQWVSRGETVMELIQLDPIELVVPVPQMYITALQEAMEQAHNENTKLVAQVAVDSLPRLLEGEIISTVPQADLRSRSFPVRIRINNPRTATGHLLQAGMLARATMFLGKKTDIVMVKKDALVLGGLQKSVYVVGTDPKTQASVANMIPVEVGAAIADWIQVIGNVQPGDQVVVEGNERLAPGQSIAVTGELNDEIPVPSRQNKVDSGK